MAIAIPFNSISISTEVFQNNQIIRTADLSNTPFVNNNMNAAFRNCYNLTTIYNMNTNVTNMTATFYSCHNLTNIPSIPNSVTTIGDMLADCTNFNKVITIPNSVTYMRGTFYKCTNLKNAPTTIPSSVTNMFGTFSECTNLVNVPNSIPNSVTNTGSLFYNCNKITSAPNISSATLNVVTAFYGCTNLTGNIYVHSPIITCAASCFSNTSLMKNVYIPYYNLYTNKTNCPTRNSFVSAGYTENGSNCGVYLKNLTPLLTINPTPSDATVTLTANSRTLTATSMAVQPNTTVTYTVSKSGYITNTGSFVVNTVNRTEQIVLPQLCTFTINPTPSNATVTLTATGYTQQGNSITVPSGTTVSYSVAKSNCITTTGSEVITSTHTTNVSVKCKLTVNTDPIDASVTFSTGTVSGHDCTVPYNTTVTYYASKSGYVTSDPQNITLTSNTSVPVTLTELFTLTINPTPSNATVTLTAAGYTQQNNSIAVPRGTNVSYTVSKSGLNSKTGSITVNSTTTESIILTATLTLNPTPSDATVVLTATGSTQSGNSITVPYGTSVSYSVAKSNCITTTGSETVTSTHTTNVSVKCKLTVNTTPIDATVTFSTGTVSGHECTVSYNTQVTYTISKSGYITSQPYTTTLTQNEITNAPPLANEVNIIVADSTTTLSPGTYKYICIGGGASGQNSIDSKQTTTQSQIRQAGGAGGYGGGSGYITYGDFTLSENTQISFVVGKGGVQTNGTSAHAAVAGGTSSIIKTSDSSILGEAAGGAAGVAIQGYSNGGSGGAAKSGFYANYSLNGYSSEGPSNGHSGGVGGGNGEKHTESAAVWDNPSGTGYYNSIKSYGNNGGIKGTPGTNGGGGIGVSAIQNTITKSFIINMNATQLQTLYNSIGGGGGGGASTVYDTNTIAGSGGAGGGGGGWFAGEAGAINTSITDRHAIGGKGGDGAILYVKV